MRRTGARSRQSVEPAAHRHHSAPSIGLPRRFGNTSGLPPAGDSLGTLGVSAVTGPASSGRRCPPWRDDGGQTCCIKFRHRARTLSSLLLAFGAGTSGNERLKPLSAGLALRRSLGVCCQTQWFFIERDDSTHHVRPLCSCGKNRRSDSRSPSRARTRYSPVSRCSPASSSSIHD